MAEPTRTSFQAESDRVEIARRYLQQQTQSEIGRVLGMTQQMVSYDLAIIRKRWLKSSIMDFDARKAEELARVDRLERTYWDEWEESKKPKETTSTEKVQGGKSTDGRMRAGVKHEQRDGNPSYLAGVQWCIEQRCRIIGIDKIVELSGQMVRRYLGVDVDKV